MDSEPVFLGVDVGSGSVRAVAVDGAGLLLASAVENLEINHPKQDYYEQSSEQIWSAVCESVRRAVSEIGSDRASRIKAIGFDATCSLVILDSNARALSISTATKTAGDDRIWDVMMWMDHRAIEQADRINATKYDRLKYVGKQMSPEMEPPKLLWLKENAPDVWRAIGHVMDLTDFLTFKASGSLIRSQCTVVSKWLYEADSNGGRWDKKFWSVIGLPELADSPKIGTEVRTPGSVCGTLTADAAARFGLPPSMASTITVAVGIIDAHAGVLGVLGSRTPERPHLEAADIEEKLSIISGTSACHMAMSKEAHFVDGVWGPNFGVILDGFWLNEAGQSALGPVLDEIADRLGGGKSTLGGNHKRLIDELTEYQKKHGALAMAALTKELHIWPDYRGNRSPLADPNCKGVIAGLRLQSDIDQHQISSTAVLYLAHVQGLAYATRFIMETIARRSTNARKPFSSIYLCGGLQKNPIYVQTHADVCRMPVVIPRDSEVVARGAAILGASASGLFASITEAMRSLSCDGVVIEPRSETYEFHEKKYRAYRALGNVESEVRRIMNEKLSN